MAGVLVGSWGILRSTVPDNKKHHYVPQFLLRNFAVEGSDRKAVAVADLKAKRFYDTAPIRQQCAKDYLYGKDPGMERLLGEAEGLAALVIHEALVNHVLPEEGTKGWLTLLSFMAIQRGRTPATGRQADAMATYFAREMLKQPGPGYEPPPPEILSKLVVENSMSPVEGLQMDANLAPQINDLADLLVVNETNLDFVLADVGVVFFNDWAREYRGGGADGFSCQGLQIFLPLSPRHLWIKFDPYVYGAHHRSTVRARDLSDVEKINRLMTAVAEQNVYFSGRTTNREALARFDEHVRSPGAERVRLVKLHEVGGGSYAIVYQPLSLNIPTDLTFLRQHRLAMFVPVDRRGKMHRYYSYSRRTVKGEKSDGPPQEPRWITEGRYTIEVLA